MKQKVLSLKEAEQKRISDAVADIVSGRITEISDSYAGEIERLSDELETVLGDKENLVQENTQHLTEIDKLTSENLDLTARLRFLEEEQARAKAEIVEQYEQHKAQVNEQLAVAGSSVTKRSKTIMLPRKN